MLTSRAGITSPVAVSVRTCAGSAWTGAPGWKSPASVSLKGVGVGRGVGADVAADLGRAGCVPVDPPLEQAVASSRTITRTRRLFTDSAAYCCGFGDPQPRFAAAACR